jgi:hypothetical protein
MVERHFACIEDRLPNGRSVYRALARQVYGNPDLYEYAYSAVQDHWMRVSYMQNHVLLQMYRNFERHFGVQYPGDKTPIFPSFCGALTCPDMALCPCAEEKMARMVLTVMANALHVRIVLSKKEFQKEISEGDAYHRVCRIEFRQDERIQNSKCRHTIDSLVEDQSGKALIEYMARKKHSTTVPQIKEISWWLRDPSKYENSPSSIVYEDFDCYNEYRDDNTIPQPPPTDPSHLYGLNVFTICVSKSIEMTPALDLLNAALEYAPFSENPVWSRDKPTGRRRLKKYVGIDAEFIKVGLTQDEIKERWEKVQEEAKINPDLWNIGEDAIKNGNPEQLVSVLTVAIDRHVVFNFYLLDMLQNPDKGTVAALSKLYKRVIFNPDLLKIWFRYSSDMVVLDATIAHMFQGTLRPHFIAVPQYYSDPEGPVYPTFKIKSPFFNETRPTDLEFSKDEHVRCPFHLEGTYRGLACPCEFGNLDIIALLRLICNDIGFWKQFGLLPWHASNMSRLSYAKLLDVFLGTNEVFPLLNQLKNGAIAYVPKDRTNRDPKSEFFDILRAGMEEDDRALGYNIGDCVGQALMIRMIMQSDDRKL